MRIFVTVGSALPFDRLIAAMDKWAAKNPEVEIFAQIGEGQYVPDHMTHKRMVGPTEFRQLSEDADVIVAHAGMGSVITAFELGKPIVLLPRLASAREHTTDHQLHTAGWLRSKASIFVANSEDELGMKIAAAGDVVVGGDTLDHVAPENLTNRLRASILDLA